MIFQQLLLATLVEVQGILKILSPVFSEYAKDKRGSSERLMHPGHARTESGELREETLVSHAYIQKHRKPTVKLVHRQRGACADLVSHSLTV